MSRLCPSCRLTVDEDVEACPRDGTPMPLDPTAVRDVTADIQAAFADPLLGQTLSGYRIDERIGTGGMGIVYRASQPLIGKSVAIKVLRPEIASDPEQMKRLLDEARAVTAIHHRGIIDIYGFGQLPDGRQYIVMEHLVGATLEDVLGSDGKIGFADALALLDEILSALSGAHAAGVIHRDLKPSNIFLAQQTDGGQYVKLLDFGLAKRAKPGKTSKQTRISLMVGTPEFMAPEQARGEPVGPTTDLYSLGVIAFQMITGQLPFTGATPIETVLQHLDKPPPRPSSINPEVTPELETVVLSLLAKDPAARPPAAELVRMALRRLNLPGVEPLPPVAVTGPIQMPVLRSTPRPASSGELAKTWLSRRPLPWALGSVAASALALALFWVGRSQLAPVKLAPIAAPGPAVGVVTPPPKKVEPLPAPAPATPVVEAKPVKLELPAEPAAPSREALAQRIARLERSLKTQTPEGEQPDPLAAVVLMQARRDLTRAQAPSARRRIGVMLTDWEHKFLRHR
jgi:serine/threonine protein kinase